MKRLLRWYAPVGSRYRLPAPVPAYATGTNLVTNGDMELTTGWSNSGSPTTNERSNEQAHTLTYSRKLVSDASAEGCTQSVSGHGNSTWYEASAWLYGTDTAGLQVILGSMLTASVYAASNGAWAQMAHCGRSTTGSGSVTCRANAATTFYADDVSVKVLTLASLLSLQSLTGQADCRLRTRVTLSQLTSAGLAARFDSASSPSTGLICWRDRSKVYLEKVVSGTYSTLINTSVTYAAGQTLELRLSGSSVSVWYGGSQVGTTQTVTDGATNTLHGLFSTWAGNCLGELWVGRP